MSLVSCKAGSGTLGAMRRLVERAAKVVHEERHVAP